MIARFGKEAETPFSQLDWAIREVMGAAQTLIAWSERSDISRRQPIWEELKDKIWGMGGDDPIEAKIEEATRTIETICRPILTAKENHHQDASG